MTTTKCPNCGSRELNPPDRRKRRGCQNCGYRKKNPPRIKVDPRNHDTPLAERLRYIRVGQTIEVTADDLNKQTFYAVYIYQQGYFGPGNWMKITSSDNPQHADFSLKTNHRANPLYFKVATWTNLRTITTTRFYGIHGSKQARTKYKAKTNRKQRPRPESETFTAADAANLFDETIELLQKRTQTRQ